MKKNLKKIYPIILILILSLSWRVFATHEKSIPTLTQTINNPTLLYTQNYKNFTEKKHSCTIKKLPDGKYLIKLICLQKPIFSPEQFNQHIDTIRPYIKNFDQEYDLNNDTMIFSGSANPIFKNTSTQKKYHFIKHIKQQLSEKNPYGLLRINPETEIQLTQNEIILSDIQFYSFYPTRRYIHQLWPCTRINYWIAIASIDKKLLPAHQNFNINKRIWYRLGYCKSADSIDRPFYSWVCWASTQTFRIALLHPFLQNFDRENHGIWYTRYYGEKITGDDSSIIDFRQQLTLKNISDRPVYFRYIEVEKNNNVLLVAISPKIFDKTIKITKHQTWPLSATLTKEIFWPHSCEYTQEWKSIYRYTNNTFTE